jgi:dolichyl-phosphate-mannose-protein mannosyltransferase
MKLVDKILSAPRVWGYVGVMALASVLRLWNLSYPPTLVFDETYYVKDALTLSMEGNEKAWPEDANPAFESGDVFSYLAEPAFVVHPPLGKWLIASGMWAFGPQNSFSWRFSVAIFGILTVGLLMLVAFKMFHSHKMALAAGGLMAIDGLAIVLSRTALLDGILTFFLLLGFYFLLLDQERSRKLITSSLAQKGNGLLIFRPWLMMTGLTLGLAASVKWSGLYLLAAVGLYVVFSETLMRKHSDQGGYLTKGVLLQGSLSFLNLVPIALAGYISTWLGWILSSSGYSRGWAEQNSLPGLFAALPEWTQSLWRYHEMIYNFHVSLTTTHAYQAHPITWLLGLRPTAFFYESLSYGEGGCESVAGCSSAITALGNPIIWWFGTISLIFLGYRYLRSRERLSGLILLGVAAMYLPWLVFSGRTVFQFYSISFLPWLILALVLVLQYSHSKLVIQNTKLAKSLLLGFFGLTALVALFFLPIYLGIWFPFDLWQLRMWIPSWI